MHQHGCHLHLTLGIEGCHAHEGIGELLGGLVNLAQHLDGVGAAEHGQLPQGPVPVVVVVAGHGAIYRHPALTPAPSAAAFAAPTAAATPVPHLNLGPLAALLVVVLLLLLLLKLLMLLHKLLPLIPHQQQPTLLCFPWYIVQELAIETSGWCTAASSLISTATPGSPSSPAATNGSQLPATIHGLAASRIDCQRGCAQGAAPQSKEDG